MPTAVVVLAAGKGTRMKSSSPKVLHPIGNRPMLHHVIEAGYTAQPKHMVIVTGHGAEQVEADIDAHFPGAVTARQTEQLGTGHAVIQTQVMLENFEGDILILNGDAPLMDGELIDNLIKEHNKQMNSVTFVSAIIEDPTGLGRVVRNSKGNVINITEHKDATDEQRLIKESNIGIYLVRAPYIFEILNDLKNNNAQGEYYLTDIVKLAADEGLRVGSYIAPNPQELNGINNRMQLSETEMMYQNRMRKKAMTDGATLIDPSSVFFSHDTQIGQDVVIGPNVQFGLGVKIAKNVNIEGNCVFTDVEIEENVSVKSFSHIDGAIIEKGASVGPHARIRPATVIGENCKVGSFVEIKKSKLGNDTKTSHLTYIGDAMIGEDVNIGGGTIFANYHSARGTKNMTYIENGVSIGANNTIIAPVRIERDAFTGGGSVINDDVPADALAVERAELVIKPNYTSKQKQNKS